MGIWGFVATGFLIIGLLHGYLWWRLFRSTGTSRRWRWLGAAGLAGAAAILVGTLAAEPALHRVSGWLTAPGYVWMGVMFYLLVLLLALEVPTLLIGWALVWRDRRVARATAGAGSVAGAGSAAGDPERRADRAPAGSAPTTAESAAAGAAGAAGATGATAAGAEAPAEPAGGVGSVLTRVASADPDPAAEPGRPAAEVRSGLTRRQLVRRTSALLAGAAAVGISGYGVTRAYLPPAVKRLAVPLPRLDRRADGLRIAVIGDLHLGPLYGPRQVTRVVDIVNDLSADLIAIVGDLATSEAAAVRGAAEPLRRLRSRYGTYYVTGNHEYYVGHEEWAEVADELGLRLLRNERVEIAHLGGAIDLAGVNDPTGGRFDDAPDYAAALGDRDPSRPVVLLAHQPVQVHEAAGYGVDLQLSGHTHGGQVVPFNLLVRLEQPVVSGLGEVPSPPPAQRAGGPASAPPDGRTLVYVTNGAGFWGPPMRVGAEPDVSLLELRAA